MKNLKFELFNNKDYSQLPVELQEYLKNWLSYRFIIEQHQNKIEISMLDNEDIIVYGYFYEDKEYIDIGYIDVHEDFQRKGLAKNIFKIIEFFYNKPLENHDLTTLSGKKFWDNYTASCE